MKDVRDDDGQNNDDIYDELFCDEDLDDVNYPEDETQKEHAYKGPGQWRFAGDKIKDPEDLMVKFLHRNLALEEKRRIQEVKDGLKISDDDALWVIIIAMQFHLSLYEEIPRKILQTSETLMGDMTTAIHQITRQQILKQERTLIDSVSKATNQVLKKLDAVGQKSLKNLELRGQEILEKLEEQATAIPQPRYFPWAYICICMAAISFLTPFFFVASAIIRPDWVQSVMNKF